MMNLRLLAALTLSGLSLAACTSAATSSGPRYAPPSDTVGTRAKCEGLCNVQAQGQTLEQLCSAIVDQTKGELATPPTCRAEHPIGLWITGSAAVHDAVIVDVTMKENGEESRYALLALSTDKGWELAREVGKVQGQASENALQVVGARAADAPGLAPYAVEVRVRIDDGATKSDRVFVCGVSGSGVTCPTAIEAS